MRKAYLLSTILIAALAGFGCSSSPDTTANSACTSGLAWAGGNSGSEFMYPGRDCVGCHASNGAPKLAIAGTVYTTFTDLDSCTGTAGAVVEITDANKVVTTFTSNQVGNFFARTSTAIAMPYTAKIKMNGKERVMATPQATAACNSCHTASGLNGAPGRILAP